MKALKNHSALRTVLLFVLAISLLVAGGVGAARAVPSIVSNDYYSRVELKHVGVTLTENGKAVSGELLSGIVAKGGEFQMGRAYPEALAVSNTGTLDSFVRVSIYKYWTDKYGNKITTLSPDMIDLHLLTGNGWVKDDKAPSDAERTVLYFTSALPAGSSTPAFADTLTVNARLPYKVTQTEENGVITTTYDYDNVLFQVEVQADAVQTHSAEKAIKSAWGRTVKVSDGSLTLG